MFVDNLKLKTKSLIPVVAMTFVTLVMLGFNTLQVSGIISNAGSIIEQRDVAASEMARAGRRTAMLAYSVLGTFLYGTDTAAGGIASESFTKSATGTIELMDQAMARLPEKASVIGALKERFQGLVEEAKEPFRIGKETPGLESGRRLTPDDLDRMAQGAALLAAVDVKARALMDDMVAFNAAFLLENMQAAAELRRQAERAMLTMTIVGMMAIALAASCSLWISASKIARPLSGLAQRMRDLADGDLTVEIGGLERRDEVGDMARAVQVFKDHAADRVRLKSEVPRADQFRHQQDGSNYPAECRHG